MKKTIIAFLLLLTHLPIACIAMENQPPDTHYALVAGGGLSIKGFGETDQVVYTADIMWRYSSRPLFSVDKWWLKGSHHMWIETPISIIIHDSDSNDDHDFGIVGVNFLAVWVFPDWKGLTPFLLAGGGPRYLLADIEGMGSDINGNYQLGAGTFLRNETEHPLSIEIRYDHISNGSITEPNVPLNSVKVLMSFRL